MDGDSVTNCLAKGILGDVARKMEKIREMSFLAR